MRVVRKNTIAIAGDIREAHYDYCPTPDSSAVHETMWPLSMMCWSMTNCESAQNS
jgi:hypothetical protein